MILFPGWSHPRPLDNPRGIEGEAAQVYFSLLDHLITVAKEEFFFRGRSRRPPVDNVNALLSTTYTLLVHDCVGALETVGLDPAVGYLHADRPGRPGLALDLMEEFRPFLADRLVVFHSSTGVKSMRPGFYKTESGAAMMDDASRKEVVVLVAEAQAGGNRTPVPGRARSAGTTPLCSGFAACSSPSQRSRRLPDVLLAMTFNARIGYL